MIEIPDLVALCDFAQATYATATLESGAAHILIAERDPFVWVGARGTKDPRDFLTDALALPITALQLGPVHHGIYDAACSIAWHLLPKLAGKRVGLIGHSLGGGLAHDLGGMLAANGAPPDFIVTFEPARVGALNNLIRDIPGWDFRHGIDPIPHWGDVLLGIPRVLTQLAAATPRLNPIDDHYLAAVRPALLTHSFVNLRG